MATPISLLLEKLQTIHDRALLLDTPRSFFITLYEYIEVFDKDERLRPVNESILELRTKDFAKTNELEKATLEETKLAFHKIKDHIKQTGFENQLMTQLLNEADAYERDDGSIESSDGPVSGMHGTVMRMLICLIDDGKDENKAFARKFGIKNEEGIVVQWNFSPSYFELEKENNYRERLQYTKIWYDWDKIVYFFGLYRDYEKWRQERIEKRKFLSVLGLDEMFKELNDIVSYKNDPKRYLRTFDVPAYKVHLQRLHQYTKDILLLTDGSLQQGTIDSGSEHYFKYSDSPPTLVVDNKKVKFKKDTRKLAVLKLLMKKSKGFYYAEEVEDLEGAANELINPKNTYYETCRGISISLARVGIIDFLQYDYNQAKLNPAYKNLSK